MSLITAAARRASHFPSALASATLAPPSPGPAPPTTVATHYGNVRYPHWSQRLTLARHNLHTASQTGNFTFFTFVQVRQYCEGTDDMAALSAILGDEETDKLFKSLDNLNCGIAFAYEDAFKAVYEAFKSSIVEDKAGDPDYVAEAQASLVQKKDDADQYIDKMMSLAVTIINQQQVEARDLAASIFLMGTTFMADVIQICLNQLEVMELCLETADVPRADSAMEVVRRSVSAAVSAYKGILYMMESCDEAETLEEAETQTRRSSMASLTPVSTTSSTMPSPTSSEGSGVWAALRRMSTAIGGGPAQPHKDYLPVMPSSSLQATSIPQSPCSSPVSTFRQIPTALPSHPTTTKLAPASSAYKIPDGPPKATHNKPARLSFAGVDPFAPKKNNPLPRYASGALKPAAGLPSHLKLSPISATPNLNDSQLNPFETSFAPLSTSPTDSSKADEEGPEGLEKMRTPGLSGSVSSTSEDEFEDAFINARAASHMRAPSIAMMAASLKPGQDNGPFQDVTESLGLMQPDNRKFGSGNDGVIEFVDNSLGFDDIRYDEDPLEKQSTAYVGGQRRPSRRASTMNWQLQTARRAKPVNGASPLRANLVSAGP